MRGVRVVRGAVDGGAVGTLERKEVELPTRAERAAITKAVEFHGCGGVWNSFGLLGGAGAENNALDEGYGRPIFVAFLTLLMCSAQSNVTFVGFPTTRVLFCWESRSFQQPLRLRAGWVAS